MGDVRVLVVENDASDPVGRLGDWLTAAGADLDVVRPHAGEDLPDLTAYGAVVVMGGRMGAADDDAAPWLPAVRRALVDAVRTETPTLGVCLGAQLLGLALGGRVERNPDGPETGASLVAKRSAASGDPLFRELPITPDVLQMHDDAVTVLPPGAELLASSPGCATQAFRVGRLAWGVQFHVENTPEMVEEWLRGAASDPGRRDLDLDAVRAAALAVLPDVEQTWAPFARRFVEIAADPTAVTVARTPTVSTAEPISDKAAIRAALAAEADAARGVTPPGPAGIAPDRVLPLARRTP